MINVLKKMLFCLVILGMIGGVAYSIYYVSHRDFSYEKKESNKEYGIITKEKNDDKDVEDNKSKTENFVKDNIKTPRKIINPTSKPKAGSNKLEVSVPEREDSKGYKSITCSYIEKLNDLDIKISYYVDFDSKTKLLDYVNVSLKYEFDNLSFAKDEETNFKEEFQKQMLKEFGDLFLGFDIRPFGYVTSFKENDEIKISTINIDMYGDGESLKAVYPDDFIKKGFYYYDNYLKSLKNIGYTCK